MYMYIIYIMSIKLLYRWYMYTSITVYHNILRMIKQVVTMVCRIGVFISYMCIHDYI